MTDIQEPSQSEPLPIWYWLFMLAGAALIVLVTWGVLKGGGQSAWWLGPLALLSYVLLSGIVWRVADWLRLVAMPSAFFSSGFVNTLQQRVFWAVGPQFFGLLFLCLAAVFAVIHWGKAPKTDDAGAVPAPAVIAVVPPFQALATLPSTPVSKPANDSVSETGNPSPSATSPEGVGRWHCDDEAVLVLVREEVWAVAAMKVKQAHGVDMGVEDIAPILEVEPENIREIEGGGQMDKLCSASFDLTAHAAAKQLSLETEVDPDVVYWIERDASGNLQVGIGD